MPYRRVEFQQNQCYHIYNRGNRKQQIFYSINDIKFFLIKLRLALNKYHIKLLCYCLMPNHFHFLAQQLTAEYSISQFMQAFGVCYARFINWRYKTTGRLFQGPFKAIHIKQENYLLQLNRYIHLNPLEIQPAGFPAGKIPAYFQLKNYPYSSYPDYLGLRKGILCDINPFLSYFPTVKNYQDFVEAKLNEQEMKFIEKIEESIKPAPNQVSKKPGLITSN